MNAEIPLHCRRSLSWHPAPRPTKTTPGLTCERYARTSCLRSRSLKYTQEWGFESRVVFMG